MDKRTTIGLIVYGAALVVLCYVGGTMRDQQVGQAKTISALHQEADKETQTIRNLQTTVEKQEKELKTLQQEVDAANQKAANAEQKAETAANPR